MNSRQTFSAIRISLLAALVTVLVMLPAERVVTQVGDCGCDRLDSCRKDQDKEKIEEKKSPPKKVAPVKPAEYGEGDKKTVIFPLVIEKDLPELDEGTGVAEDTERNYLLGKEHDTYVKGMTKEDAPATGYFPERRRYILNTLNLARSDHQNGRISKENLDRLTTILKDKLDRVNTEERGTQQGKNQAVVDSQVKELKKGGKVDAANEKRTGEMLETIEKMDLDSYGDQSASIQQLIYDNIAQARALSLHKQDDDTGLDRARKLVEKLFDRVMKDCQGTKIKPNEILSLIQMGIFIGGISEETAAAMQQTCFSRTLVASLNVGAIQYEAKRCVTLGTGRPLTEGEWEITITGAMRGTGKAQIGEGGKGTWEGEAEIDKIKITQTGSAEIVSAGGKCLLRIRATKATGKIDDNQVSMPGMTNGDLPVQYLEQVCGGAQTVKP